ncbi:MAG: 3'-5' exonuclease [Bacteroidetes bacterium GWF2_43_63]|nr:MAG: 3'-5' exonuclease [Bacteroidetes bacterium GWE2_42_42]OFY52958.1 MAG: 3'-5' exonuclease [Bacteroidetes bacterium GWF2_43_63]HBG70168.1 3'-5' exonuclease [Bacteroidales bacterium]HCB62225.1 3'-5' exonuclease [Bacteroidales bacterium]
MEDYFSHILFLDIETVPGSKSYSALNERMKHLWDKKAESMKRAENDTPESLYGKAGIFAEFGKIICISTGVVNGGKAHLKSFYGHDEVVLLNEFADYLRDLPSRGVRLLCAHNGKEFDFPWICRRMMINGIRIPEMLNIQGKKPWEIAHIDTMELWKFGDYKNFTSLDLLTELFDIPTPKDDINGADVARVYYEEDDLIRIMQYCQKDVIALIQLLRRLNYMPLIPEVNVNYL